MTAFSLLKSLINWRRDTVLFSKRGKVYTQGSAKVIHNPLALLLFPDPSNSL